MAMVQLLQRSGPVPLGSPWVVRVGTWWTESGAAFCTASGVNNIADVETSNADGTVTMTKRSGSESGIVVRSTGTQWYFLRGDGCYYYNGSSTSLVLGWGVVDPVADGGTMVAVLSGSNLTFYKNGALRFSGTLLTNNTGATKHGLWGDPGVAPYYEDWDFTVGGSSVFFDDFT